jgi:hypothetical protein
MLVARSANQSLGCTRGAAPASTGKNVARASYNLDVNLAEFATKIEMNIILYIYYIIIMIIIIIVIIIIIYFFTAHPISQLINGFTASRFTPSLFQTSSGDFKSWPHSPLSPSPFSSGV